jgi:hypothetical protein
VMWAGGWSKVALIALALDKACAPVDVIPEPEPSERNPVNPVGLMYDDDAPGIAEYRRSMGTCRLDACSVDAPSLPSCGGDEELVSARDTGNSEPVEALGCQINEFSLPPVEYGRMAEIQIIRRTSYRSCTYTSSM